MGDAMMKKICSVLLAILLVLSLSVPALAAGGTERVTISTAQELLAFSRRVNEGDAMGNAVVTLAQNIDMNGYAWNAVGETEATPFSGTFDGQGHTISNLYAHLSDSDTDRQMGLFGTLRSAHVKDVKLSGCFFSSTTFLGGIAAVSRGGLIEKCFVSGRLSATGERSGAGGIVGYNTGVIRNCHASGSVNGLWQTGGIAGLASGEISGCSFNGSIAVDSNRGASASFEQYESVGGIVGCLLPSALVEDCYSLGTIEARGSYKSVGGIAGYAGSSVRRCYSASEITCSGASVGVGGIVGFLQTGEVSSCVALNPAIRLAEGSTGWGRVVGSNYVSSGQGNLVLGAPVMKNNYALSDMTVSLGGTPTSIGATADLGKKDGQNVTSSSISVRNFWMDVGFDFSGGIWVWTAGSTPTLNTSRAPSNTDIPDDPANLEFTDTQGHWAEKAIHHVVQEGVMTGDTEGTFRPEDPITRAELCSVMRRYLKLEPVEDHGFADVSGWAAGSIGALAQANVIFGDGDGRFRPNDPVTRQETAAILCRAVELPFGTVDRLFADDAQIDFWAKNNVYVVKSVGLMVGDGNNYFRPRDSLTRAEVASILSRLLSAFQ